MDSIQHLSPEQWLNALKRRRSQAGGRYFAMYSSWSGGIVTDPHLMMLPMDEHMVHRGDGVFEALRVKKSKIIDLDAHLARLVISASALSLDLPFSLSDIASICHEVVQAAGSSSAYLRIFVGRGAGGFSVNPYEPDRAELYVLVSEFTPLDEAKYKQGGVLVLSDVPAKESPLNRVKSCNYLQNVLMKKNTIDRGADFSLAVDEQSKIHEGSTENLIFLNAEGVLCVPSFAYTLAGTTLKLLLASVRQQSVLGVADYDQGDFFLKDLLRAQEIAMVGTTTEVFPIVKIKDLEFGDHTVGQGKVGSLMPALRARLHQLID